MNHNKLKAPRAAAIAIALVLCGGAAWYVHRSGKPDAASAPAADASAASADSGASVLVQTAAVSRQMVPLTMSVFGDVAAGKLESQSFPQAGQVTRLAVVAGQSVHRGDLLAVLASDPAALATYQQAASTVTFARAELARQQQLMALQLSTQSQVDAASKALADAQAALAAQARLDGAHGSAELHAPFDAVVAAIPVAQGDRVAAGTAIVQLGRTDGLKVLLAVEPGRIAELRPGMKLTLAPQREGVAGSQGVATMLSSVQTMVDPKTLMAGATALLPAGAGGGLPIGARVQGVIELGTRSAWLVPRQAVLVDDQGAYLFQLVKDKARRVAVRKLVETDRAFGVDGALDAALPVVVLGNYELTDGASARRGAP